MLGVFLFLGLVGASSSEPTKSCMFRAIELRDPLEDDRPSDDPAGGLGLPLFGEAEREVRPDLATTDKTGGTM